ncbi:MAG: hypothetical protein CUN55_21005, partial [Phototrophicales bacterium]
ELDNLLLRIKKRSLPDCPKSTENNVLRRLRLGNETGESTYWEWLPLVIARPRFLLGVCAMAVMMSASISILFTRAHISIESQHSLVARNLDFDLFASKEFFALDE